jgi:hypothetical protein
MAMSRTGGVTAEIVSDDKGWKADSEEEHFKRWPQREFASSGGSTRILRHRYCRPGFQQELLHPKIEEVVVSCCCSCFVSVFFSFLFFCFWSLLCMELDWLELLQGWGSAEKAKPEIDVARSATLRIRLRFILQHSFNFHQDFLSIHREVATHAEATRNAWLLRACHLLECLTERWKIYSRW